MTKTSFPLRAVYAFTFVAILIVEVLIALYVKDSFIRPYGGDVLVTVLICCFMRMLFLKKIPLLSLWVFIFAAFVEAWQYFDIVSILGLSNIEFFSVLIGSTFSFADLICYAVGCVIFYLCETIIMNKSSA